MKKLLPLLLACASLQAAPILLMNGENEPGNGESATRTWTLPGGVTMTVTALATSADGSTIFTANTTQFGVNNIGLGVCNSAEDCTFNAWQVDNSGRRDYVLFTFSSPIDILNVVIRQTTVTGDSDAAWSAGNGLTINQLLLALTESEGAVLNPGNERTVNIGANGVTQLLFGVPGGESDDLFKLYSIDVNAIPEPGSMALLGLGLCGLGIAARRRRLSK